MGSYGRVVSGTTQPRPGPWRQHGLDETARPTKLRDHATERETYLETRSAHPLPHTCSRSPEFYSTVGSLNIRAYLHAEEWPATLRTVLQCSLQVVQERPNDPITVAISRPSCSRPCPTSFASSVGSLIP
jgi:hypothetical protein